MTRTYRPKITRVRPVTARCPECGQRSRQATRWLQYPPSSIRHPYCVVCAFYRGRIVPLVAADVSR